jgi:uncharacterized cupredoxin-like copper-binding protein
MEMVMFSKRNVILGSIAVAAAAALGTGVAIAAGGPAARPGTSPSVAAPADAARPGYPWYRSMMNGYHGGPGAGMMGFSPWMMSQAGYRWMTGGSRAPGWMRGGTIPAAMMGGGIDPGSIMGTLFADAPGPRVSPAQAQRLSSQAPAGASIDRAARTITFTTASVSLTVVASPSGAAGSFRIAGLTDPSVSVPAGAHVSIQLVNADADTAHGLAIMPAGAERSYLPMMTAAPVFPQAALWFLGQPTTAGMHAGTLAFTATTPGRYQYLCPIPGHARDGVAGSFTVR